MNFRLQTTGRNKLVQVFISPVSSSPAEFVSLGESATLKTSFLTLEDYTFLCHYLLELI